MAGDTGSCQIQNLLPTVTLFQMSSLFYPLYAQSFTTTIPEGGGVLRMNMTSPSFNPILLVLDSKGNFLGSSGGSTTTGAEILAGLPAGPVTIVAASAGAGGSFSIRPSLEPFRTCTPTDYTLKSTVNGSLSDASCRFLDLRQPSTNVRPVDVYKLSLPAFTLTDIVLDSTAFNAFLYLIDASTQKIVASNDDISQLNLNAELFMSIPQGEYLLVATTSINATGAYTLQSDSAAPVVCNQGTISLPGTVQGSLTGNDCQLWEFVPFASDDSFIRPYTMDVPRKALVQIDMTSTQFDTYLVLVDEKKVEVDEDDNGSGTSNARLTLTLNPGKYTILANALSSGATGNYTLATNLQDPRTCPIGIANSGDTVTGNVATSDCRIRDLTVGVSAAQYSREFRLDVPDGGGGVLSTDVTSTQFQPGLVLATTDGSILAVSPQSNVAGAARLQTVVTPGSYNILVYSASSSTGNFTLKPTIFP